VPHLKDTAMPQLSRLDPLFGPGSSLVNRRDVLRVGSVSVAATLVPSAMLPVAKGEGSHSASFGKAKSVIYLWMGGGVTHLESFDPKPEAPEEIRGTLAAIDTKLPGVQFAEACPNLAKIADQLAVVRSFSHDSNDHLLSQAYTLSGKKVTMAQLFAEPNIGSIIWHLQGSRNGLPGYIAVPGITRPGPPPYALFVGGWLGDQYAPFCVGGQPEQPDFTVGEKSENPSPICEEDLSPKLLDMPAGVSLERLDRRVSLRQAFDQAQRNIEQQRLADAVDGNFSTALGLLTSRKIREAFDITHEPATVRDAYGRTKIGGRCLMAARLVEAGARFVMVDYGYDPDYGNLWDNHNVPIQKFPHISQMALRGYHVAGMDRAFAALITDLKQRGLLEQTLVVFLTEFGRTPKINKDGGRDHWGACGSIFFAGAGTKVGQVVGASDKQGAYPTTRPYGPADIAATIYHNLGVDPEKYLLNRENRPVPILDHGHVIEEVVA
jgi:hypothetical protein